jgi:hypothetical protein
LRLRDWVGKIEGVFMYIFGSREMWILCIDFEFEHFDGYICLHGRLCTVIY